MGGYGFYVWGSYGVTFVLLAAELIMIRSRKRRVAQQAQVRRGMGTRNAGPETVL